jgi:sterol desaturase/sphingolipid hydroxylase (fatty acid hydroxylase superfamily)
VGPTLAGIVIGFLVLSVVFGTAERIWPAVPDRRWWRRGAGTDLAYWFFTPLVTKALTRGSVVAALVVLALLAGVRLDAESLRQFAQGSGSWVQRQPTWLQIVEVLLLGDLLGYASHRFFHGRRLWRFHAVHHSSRDVDWLSAVRLHPVNDVVSRLFQVVPFLLLGFPPTILAAYAPFLTLYAIGLHANVPWTFGPLRYVLASPAFHRWHHTSQAEGLDRNFAGLFPFLDLAFGTFYMPKDRQPAEFGIRGEEMPEGLWAQLLHPFRRAA